MLKCYKRKIISFDFDNTLYDTFIGFPRLEIFKYLRDLSRQYEIVIITARHDREVLVIENFIKKYNLPIAKIYFTDQALKGPLLKQLNVIKHIDDSQRQLESMEENGIEAISVFTLLR